MNRIRRLSHAQRLLIGGATVVVVGFVVFASWKRSPNGASGMKETGSTPETCVAAMLQAAAAGNVEDYVGCFAGEMRQQLEDRVARGTRDRFAAELRTAEGDLKNYVTSEWDSLADDEATFTLERIYSQFHERHTVRMRRMGTEWKIVALSPLDRFAPEIPYGTPVTPPPVESAESLRNDVGAERPTNER